MQVDEIHLKKSIEFDGKERYEYVDYGTGVSDDSEEATLVLVYMLISLNGHFKTPIAYYFIHGLAAQEIVNITTEILNTLHDYAINNICSLTFDGTIVNISMAECLGANFKDLN